MKELTEYGAVKAPPQQQVIAMLLAAGRYDVPEIAREVGVAPSAIYALQENELFQRLVASYKERFTPEEIDEARTVLRLDAMRNVEFLKAVREGAIESTEPRVLALRLKASEVLFARQIEKTSASESTRPIVVNIDARRFAQIMAVVEEDAAPPAIDIERDPD